MNGIETTRETLDLVHQYLEAAIGDCDNETLTKMLPGSTVGPISGIYLHAISSEDWAIQELLQGKPKLILAEKWYEKLGIPSPATGRGAGMGQGADIAAGLPGLRKGGVRLDGRLAGIGDGRGPEQGDPVGRDQTHNAAWILADVVHSHLGFHAGEIAALKGVFGLKGLPW